MGKTNTRNYSEFEKTLGKEVTGYNNRKYSLYELSLSANNYQGNHNNEYRELIQKKYSKIYNCESETIPANLLEEVYGLSETFKEIWRTVPDYNPPKYEASNLGRIRNINGNIIKQVDAPEKINKGYLVLNEYKSIYVYQLVAKAFFSREEFKGKQIHHINNNGYDCRPENLILLEKGQHSIVHNFPDPELTEDPNYGQ